MRKFIVLNDDEIAELFRQSPETGGDGGFQAFLVRLQKQYRAGTKELRLEEGDLDDIQRYAFDYKQGGWENRLIKMFSRHLGPMFGREE